MIVGIYKISSPNNKIYIGQSRNINKRWDSYYNLKCINQPRLYNSLKKYGPKNHIFEIIEECNLEELNIRERYWQDYYNVLDNNKGLNCFLTKTNIKPLIRSEEYRKKLGNKYWLGKKHSLETIEKMKNNNKKAMLGTKNSEETIKKKSESKKYGNNNTARLVLHLETGIYYPTIKEACKAYNYNYTRIVTILVNDLKFKTKYKLELV